MKRFLYLVATDQINSAIISIVKLLLWVLSCVYRFLTALHRFFYSTGILKTYRLPCPVISIGNLTVGGTGKTPLIEYLVEVLQNRKIQIVILTRGYMGEGIGSRTQESDEAVMLKNAFPDVPVLVGANRVKSAQEYLEHQLADVFLLDDGFQYRRLLRDLNIVVIDATNPWGNGCLLPRGILRESKNVLKKIKIFILTRADLGRNNLRSITKELRSKSPEALIVEAIHKPVSFIDARFKSIVDLNAVSGRDVCTLCSIGNPDSFVQTVAGLEANAGMQFVFMDHHIYMEDDIKRIVRSCQGKGITTIITTEKDAVKFEHFLDMFPKEITILSLRIRIDITEGEGQFLERIDRIL